MQSFRGIKSLKLTDVRKLPLILFFVVFFAVTGLCQPLSGAYTIGGISPDFPTFSTAVAAIDSQGISGPVTFNVRPGAYNEQIQISPVQGASDSSRVTFQSENGDSSSVILTYEALSNEDNYVVRLNGADFITFREMTLEATNSYYANVLLFAGAALGNIFEHNVLIGIPNQYSIYQALVYNIAGGGEGELLSENEEMQTLSGDMPDSANVFLGNRFINGSYGIFMEDYSEIYGTGYPAIIISDNTFEDQYESGIYLGGLWAPFIKGNVISLSEGYGDYGYIAINLYDCPDSLVVVENRITVEEGSGINIYNCSSDSGRNGSVINNFIAVGGNSAYYGLSLSYSNNHNIFFNNINITSDYTDAYALYMEYGNGLRLFNNIFANPGSGYSVYNYYASFISNYNNFYTTGTYLAYSINNIEGLSGWQSITGQDSASVSVDPFYKSRMDLHVRQIDLYKKGLGGLGVIHDVDGEPRDPAFPSIGADEFTPDSLDAGITTIVFPTMPFVAGNQPVIIRLKNFGTDTIQSATIDWKVNDTSQTPFLWTGTLLSGEALNVSIDTFNFVAGDTYNIEAAVSGPNGGVDAFPENDSASSGDLYPGLSGTYTIGGDTSDFETFTEAVEVLNRGGASGPVTFNVRPGVYNEQIRIRAFPGRGCGNPVTFRSENGDSASVVLTYSASFNANYVVRLDSADGVEFHDMTFLSTGTSYGIVMDIRGGSDCNLVKSCRLASAGRSTSSNVSVIYSGNFNDMDNIFEGNTIEGGSFGFYWQGSNRESGTVIRNNKFSGQYYMGVYVYNQQSLLIEGNEIISDPVSYTNYYGIYIYSCYDSIHILRNDIRALNGGYGLSSQYSYGSEGKEGFIANNFISIGGTGTAYGITNNNSYYQQYYHNSVHVYSSAAASNSRAYFSSGSNSVILQNNILYNSKNGYAVYISGSGNTSDYNDLFTKGPNLGYYNGDRANLEAWKSATGWDTHSISAYPLFVSNTDLHVNKVELDSAGLSVAVVSDDFDGESRTSPPDIGADEFMPTGTNVSLITLIRPEVPFAAGTYPLSVVLKNSGVENLDSVHLNWTIRDTLRPEITWTGNLPTGAVDTILLGQEDFLLGVNNALKVWVISVNGITDLDQNDDTLEVRSLYPELSGTYTIGGDSSDFSGFNEAVEALNGGITGPVTFNVRPGTYNEQIWLKSFSGNSCENRVLFQSENGDSTSVVLTFGATTSTNNYVVRLDGADGIEFRNITIHATGTSYGTAMDIRGGSDCNLVKACRLISAGRNTSTNVAVVYSGNDTDSSNIFEGNTVEGGSYGIYMSGSIMETGTAIRDNRFTGQYYMGIYLYYQRSPLIEGNIIVSDPAAYTSYFGIYLYYCYDSLKVLGNDIRALNGGYGIYSNSCYGSSGKEGLIANNFISIGGTVRAYGITNYYSQYQQYYHNNVHLYSSATANNSRAYYYVSGSIVTLQNNILFNSGNGHAIYANGTGITSDYNDLYSNGLNLGYFNGERADLGAWKAATIWDAHSISVDPLFVSNIDLHVNKGDLDSAGLLVPGVTVDIDGELRSTPPDIGADEFTPSGTNAALTAWIRPEVPFIAGSYPVSVVLKNSGAEPLDSVILNWMVRDTIQQPVTWTGNLLKGETDTLFFGLVDFRQGVNNALKTWIVSVNDTTDLDQSDDTLEVGSLYPQLLGTYTIGAGSDDFENFTQAVEALNMGGVAGPVTFNILPGGYNEQIWIKNFPGSGCGNPVIFQAENGDSSSVLLSFVASSAANFVIRLDGADGVEFRNMTMQANSTSYGKVMDILGGSDCNLVKACHLISAGRSTSTNVAVVYSGNDADLSNEFDGNTIQGGSYGFYFYGSALESGTVIRNNNLSGQYYMGVYLYNQSSPEVAGNIIISDPASYTNYYGAYLYYCYDSTKVTGNDIRALNGGYGLYSQYCYGNAGREGLIANNFISAGGTGIAYGIVNYYSNYQRYYHNSVHIYSSATASNSRTFYYAGGNQVVLQNNILSNSQNGYAIYSNGSALTSDYNDLYSESANLGYYNGNRTDLAAWQSAGNWDDSSVSVDPVFISNNDLHVSNVVLDKAGTPISLVKYDFDGQPRDPATPDIGADEFSTATEDAGIWALVSPSMPFPSGDNDVKVYLVNNATLPLDSVSIYWEVNSVLQSPYQWTGTLGRGDTTLVNLGTFFFKVDSAYNLKLWTSMPNGLPDEEPANDTLHANNLYAALSGTYTIGGVSPDFNTIARAVNAMVRGDVLGPVTFNIRDGNYNEQVSIPEISGASATNTVTFQSESEDSSLVVITSDATSQQNYVLQLNGADHFIFRKLKFQSQNTSYGTVIDLRNGATNNRFLNNHIQGINTTSTSNNLNVIYSPYVAVNDNDNLFKNNFIQYGSWGVNLETSSTETGNRIEDNIFENQNYGAIRLYRQEAPEVLSNLIATTSNRTDFHGIFLQSCTKGLQVGKNKIHILKGGFGIYENSCGGSLGNEGLVSNNFVSIEGTSTAYGIYLYYCSYQKVYHNNINVAGSHTTAGRSLFTYSGSDLTVRNNVLANTGKGYSIYIYAPGSNVKSDYNDLFTKGTNLGYWTANIHNIAKWQQVSGQDANSVSIDPLYFSVSDLHVLEGGLNNVGTPLSEVEDDIDGEARSASTPDIGADEFVPFATDDAGILSVDAPRQPFPAGAREVKVTLKNYGAAVLNNVTIRWSVNNVQQPDYEWTGALASGAKDPVTLGSFSFNVFTAYTIEAWTEKPNNTEDVVSHNDYGSLNNIYAALTGTYTIGGTNPDFSNFSTAVSALSNGGVVGPVIFNVRNGVYDEQIRIPEIAGASASNSIKFRSESGDSSLVRLGFTQNSARNYVVRLDSADHITFEKLTIESRGTGYGITVDLRNGAANNSFTGNIIKGVSTTSTSNNFAVIYAPSASGLLKNNNTFKNNVISRGSKGLVCDASGTETGLIIEGNIFSDQNYMAIEIFRQEAPVIAKNIITTTSGRTDFFGLRAYYCHKATNISRNDINIANGGYGIYTNDCEGELGNEAKLVNNFVSIGGTGNAYGIYSYSSNYQRIYHNNINISSTHLTSGRALYSYAAFSQHLYNNIFANEGGGYAVYFDYPGANVLLDYNDYYVTGSTLGYWQGGRTDLAAWKNATLQDAHSISEDPLYYSATDLHVTQIALDSTALNIAGINDDIDGEVRNANFPDIGADEFVYRPDDVGITVLVAPETGCGLDSAAQVIIQITNFGGLPQTAFDVAYSVNGGAAVVENVAGLTVPPGGKVNYTFTATTDISQSGVYSFQAYSSLSSDLYAENDSLSASVISHPVLTTPPGNLQPADQTTGLTAPVTFSWSPVPDVLYYDLYIWLNSASMPLTPTVSGITGISYIYRNALQYGEIYKWKVIARNVCSEIASTEQTFSIRDLPDVVVDLAQGPATAFSGQNISVNWTIRNAGSGNTGSSQWFDVVYLSADTLLNTQFDKYLGGVSNLTALNPGQSYSQTTSFTLPKGISGNYYLIVLTNRYRSLLESNFDNNLAYSDTIPITLTPPPDLKVVSSITPENAFSGQPISLSWTVKNNGPGETGNSQWHDRIYLSEDTILSAGDVQLGVFQHTGALDPDSSYSRTESVELPEAISGSYYLFFQTDIYNNVFEYVFEHNNTTISDSVNVILTPPTDYVVTSVTARDNVSPKDTFTVHWTVENQGGSIPKASGWRDAIYISGSPTFDIETATLLGSSLQSTKLQPFTSYNAQRRVNLPANISGPYYVYVTTDYQNHIFEHIHEDNNTTRSTNAINVLNPDLTVSLVTAPAEDSSGKAVTVSWTVENAGPGKVISTSWRDRIYLSQDATFNPSTALKLDSLSYNTNYLDVNGSIVKQKTVTLPNGISGTYYVYVLTDAVSALLESNEGNNVNRSAVMNVILSPSSDLQVDTIVFPDTVRAGDHTPVQFTISNKGAVKTPVVSWKDKVYISSQATFNSNAVLLNNLQHSGLVLPDSGYTVNTFINIPATLTTGTYYIYVFTDAEDKIYEHLAENNNILRSGPVYVRPYPPIDLAVTSVIRTGELASGMPFTVEWTVQNIGEGATIAPTWHDAVYLSSDTIWDQQSDIFIGEQVKAGPVSAGGTYSASKTLTVPNGISGPYYLLVVTDYEFRNPDVNLTNNYETSEDVNGDPEVITVTLTNPPDLIVTSFNAPANVTSGQPFKVNWTVKNNGTGATLKNSWTERVYLSADFQISNDDRVLGSYVRNGSLAPGESYGDSLMVGIPVSLSGNYVLIFKTDNNNVVYEHTAENNNTLAVAVNAVQPPATDLIVSSIDIPSTAVAGQSVNITWKTKNISSSPVSGSLKEAVYFSADSIWDISDILLGTYDVNLNLAPLAENTKTVTANVPGLPLGDYYVLVQTDILNNIYESNDTNNTSSSATTLSIDVLNLKINVLTHNTLIDNTNIYYKIVVPDSLEEESLLITLEADSANGANEMYVRFGATPDRVNYDFSHENPFQGNQEIVIPELKAGTYYLMLYGNTSAGSSQNIELLARILNFEIRSVNANKGGNTGYVTVLVKGSKFEKGMSFSLEGDGVTIDADSITVIDPTKVYVRFNLEGAPLGVYDLTGENSKQEEARLNNGFTVVPGLAPELLTNILHPSASRPSSIEALTIQFTNAGNTDLPDPVLVLKSMAGAPVGFTLEELKENKTELTIPLKELNGPEGILRPGAIGSVIIYTKATSALGFLIEIPNFN